MALKYGEILNRFKDVRVMVVGDYMHDHYRFGRIERLAPEAPVPIFIEESDYIRGGGAMNVVNNLHAFGCSTQLSSASTPSIKTRYMVGHSQVFRIDRDLYQAPDASEVAQTLQVIHEFHPHALVISDYAKGWIGYEMAQEIIRKCRSRGVAVIVDPKGEDWGKYTGATLICPNKSEHQKRDVWTCREPLLVKMGEQGAVLILNDHRVHEVRAKAKHVYDVTGAGDTVVATVAAVLAAGGTMFEAAELAMVTAGYVVGEVGTAVCPFETLKRLVGEES